MRLSDFDVPGFVSRPQDLKYAKNFSYSIGVVTGATIHTCINGGRTLIDVVIEWSDVKRSEHRSTWLWIDPELKCLDRLAEAFDLRELHDNKVKYYRQLVKRSMVFGFEPHIAVSWLKSIVGKKICVVAYRGRSQIIGDVENDSYCSIKDNFDRADIIKEYDNRTLRFNWGTKECVGMLKRRIREGKSNDIRKTGIFDFEVEFVEP